MALKMFRIHEPTRTTHPSMCPAQCSDNTKTILLNDCEGSKKRVLVCIVSGGGDGR